LRKKYKAESVAYLGSLKPNEHFPTISWREQVKFDDMLVMAACTRSLVGFL